jgi:hypothetical protein
MYDSQGNVSNDNPPYSRHEIFLCSTCEGISLHSTDVDWDGDRTLSWPHPSDLHHSVPQTVADSYKEAKKVQELSPYSFAVMIRRALEALCADRGVARAPLYTMLKALAGSGEIPAKLAEVTDVLRELGNTGAHHEPNVKLTVPMTWALDDFFRVVVEYVYVAPSKLAKFQAKLVTAKKKQGQTPPAKT